MAEETPRAEAAEGTARSEAAEGAPRAAVIVACGGSGARFRDVPSSDDTEKQFVFLAGKPVLAHTLDVLERHPRVELVVLILPRQSLAVGEDLVKGHWPAGSATGYGPASGSDYGSSNGYSSGYGKVRAVLPGGKNRQESVGNGLAALTDLGWRGLVLVQDGVRPCTPGLVYDRVIDGAVARGNAVAAIPVRDTLKRSDSGMIVRKTLDRRDLWQIQTPQGFWMHDLCEAYAEGRRRGLQVTDDASLVEALGRPVYLVEGDLVNMKLTYRSDVALLDALLQRTQT